MKKKFITGLLLAGAAFVLASCGESTTPTTNPTTALPPETTTKTDPTPTTTQKEVGPDEVDFGDEKDPVVLKSKCMQQLNSMYQEAELSEDEEKIANVVYIITQRFRKRQCKREICAILVNNLNRQEESV